MHTHMITYVKTIYIYPPKHKGMPNSVRAWRFSKRIGQYDYREFKVSCNAAIALTIGGDC